MKLVHISNTMDIELARTFLEISRCGSFVAAAEKLHVTQTAVTARIRNLESAIGCTLFIRNRSGATLTANGEAFRSFANQLVQTWERARIDLPLPDGHDQKITLGGETALWNPLVLNWIAAMREACPGIALQSITGNATELYQYLNSGVIDLAVVYRPDYLPQFHIKQLMEEKLVQVETRQLAGDYVFVDWGENFKQQHHQALPEKSHTALSFDYGPLALSYILEHGGSGYFRESVVAAAIKQKQLRKIPSAPEFAYPVYLVKLKDNDETLIESAISALAASLTAAPQPGRSRV